MPRMEIEPADESTEVAFKLWQKKGDGSTTFDVCQTCADEVDGLSLRDISDKLKPKNGEPSGSYCLTGEVEHPPYEDEEYFCEICGQKLRQEDN